MNTQEIAKKAVKIIVSDLSDRRGLGNEWDQIDKDIQDEIKEQWTRYIEAAFEGRVS